MFQITAANDFHYDAFPSLSYCGSGYIDTDDTQEKGNCLEKVLQWCLDTIYNQTYQKPTNNST